MGALNLRKVAVSNSTTQQTATDAVAKPDLVLELEGHGQRILVYGIEHTSAHAHVAEAILKARPYAVVVETAVTPEHGARPGNIISCRDRVIEGPAAFYMRMFCQVAAALQADAQACGGDITATELWQKASAGAYRGEQLTYIAAFATNTPLVFGDRPKDITYRRLYTLTSIKDLDEGFGLQAAANYRDMLHLPQPEVPLEAVHVVQQIAMQEREAVMCSVAHDVALGLSPMICAQPDQEGCFPAPEPHPSSSSGRGGDVVMVVGSAHLPGLKALWESGHWRFLLDSDQLMASGLLTAPPLDTVPEKQVGLKRGLLTALLRMSASPEVVCDVEQTLGSVPQFQRQAYEAVSEVYGSTRTILACLPRELLDKVCVGAPQEGGGKVDMYSLLEPVRAIRPSQGGPAYSEEMVTFLRSLNFDLD